MSKHITLRGEARDRAIAKIQSDLALNDDASVTQRCQAIHEYKRQHPEYSDRILCAAAALNLRNYQYFVETGATGIGRRTAHRQEILESMRTILSDRTDSPGVYETARQLHAQGITCSESLVSELMQEMGYVTSARSINGIEQILNKLPYEMKN